MKMEGGSISSPSSSCNKTIVASIAQHDALQLVGLCAYDPVPDSSVEAALDAYGNNIRENGLYILIEK
jgi:hypothetical protein